MFKKVFDILCSPIRITPEQKEINEREWQDPRNWKGWKCPSYSSSFDTRPFVQGRLFKPRDSEKTKWTRELCSLVHNRAHPRGRIWLFISRAVVIAILLFFLGVIFANILE
jgi:hypothetical protein